MSKFNRFGNMFPPKDFMNRSYLMSEKPFKIKGNLYFVGNTWCSSHLIDTGDGLILLDTPCIAEMPYLIDSIWSLGYDIRETKYIIISHAHVDHYGSVNALKYLTDAKVCMSIEDTKDMKKNSRRFDEMNKKYHGYNESCEVDICLRDGDIIELGNTRIRCILTPGHTIGTMSHFWDLEDNGKVFKVGIYGGAGFVSVSTKALKENNLPITLQTEFSKSIDKVWDEPVDIMLGNHPFHNDTFEKYNRLLAGEKDAFVDSSEWHTFLQDLKYKYSDFLKLTNDEIEEMYKHSSFLLYRNIDDV